MSTLLRGRIASVLGDSVLFVVGCLAGTVLVAVTAFFVALWAKLAVFMWALFF
jgi:hypothetical protein